MTNATATPLSRIILVGGRDRLGSGKDAPAIRRRYRLARLHVNGQSSDTGRHSHLRHSHD